MMKKIGMLFLLAPALAAAEVDTSDWACEYCPFDDGYRAQIRAGATSVSDDAARFGNFTGYDEEGAYGNVDGQGRYNGDGYRIDYVLEDLGLDSRAIGISLSSDGLFGVDFGYRELPYRRFDTTRTVFTQSSSGTLTLPSGWVSAGTTGNMTQLASSLQKTVIGTDRQVIDFGGYWNPRGPVRVFADFRRQSRDGIDIKSGGTYTQAALLPRWIDFETDQVDAGLQYATDSLSLTLAWYASFFTNRNPALTWETPYLATPGMATLRMANEPDNEFQQVSLSGKYRLATWDTVLAFMAASGSGEQDEPLLPYTINSGITAAALPRATLDGKVDTLNYAFTVTSRPLDKLRVKFGYRYDERDNRTPVSEWNRVIVDAFSSGGIEQNVPYSYDRMHSTTSIEYALRKNLRVSAGYEYREINRDNQEVAEQTVNTGWGQVRVQPWAWLDVRAKGGASARGVDRYDESVAVSLGQNPLMQKYNLAYRYREFGEIVATVSPLEKPVSFSVSVLFADDDYKDSLVGLNGAEEFRATADVSWAINDNATVYLAYGRDSIDAHQTGAEQFGWWDWSAFHEDRFDHAGFGMRWRPTEGKLGLRLDYNRGEGETRIAYDSLSGGPSELPDLESTLDSLRVEASYAVSERMDLTFDLRYERFEVTDWALVSETTLPTILTLGADPWDYDVYAAGIGIRYSFGDDEIALAE
ncbi:MAG: MtrB/PioB family decaheme-associated outer membrane protein [Gammaproteobacteria bacterium]|nr:MtrB/PioB family decaheme-associated outer membrane protein [Gammaproteobacteria bacterium]NNF50467.1 MtrB/PioB family decaheme-associated outer membrane protein [Woeseiaceae bacterium]MBT8093401.1 MtrB/PioB family decaheme-associated outer membrane protein [Gammaproteobacteria bacterium]MBT8106195.1 MtrB/PioB family decaheme-associated outer membrane protein [Gammaproteobacteria bacterium]NNK26209.1 MtrB/PioB family decaheme-associated outer membrane protein [Woeseiaceae bacterium]